MGIRFENRRDSVEFGVTKLPNRKSKCLYLARGAQLEPVAYFRSDEDAERFNRALECILKILRPEEGTTWKSGNKI